MGIECEIEIKVLQERKAHMKNNAKYFNKIILFLIIPICLVSLPAQNSIAAYCNGEGAAFHIGPDLYTTHLIGYEIILDITGIIDQFDIRPTPDEYVINGVDVGPLDKDKDGFSDRDFQGRNGNIIRWGATRTITAEDCTGGEFLPTCGYGVLVVRRKAYLSEGSGTVRGTIRAQLPNGKWETYDREWNPYFSGCIPADTLPSPTVDDLVTTVPPIPTTFIAKGRGMNLSLPEIIDYFRKSRSWAVIIGISDYSKEKNGYAPLPYSINDAQAV